MRPHTTDKLHFNFGFLLAAPVGESRVVAIDYPTVKLEEIYLEPLTGSFRASRTTQGLFLKGVLRTFIETECARCTEPFLHPAQLEIDDHFYMRHLVPPGEYFVNDTGILDLGPLVRELAITAIPMQPICRPDCLGLCVECGANLNQGDCGCTDDAIDPRLAALRDLLNSDN